MKDENQIKDSNFKNIKVDSETFIQRILELLVLISFIVLTVIIGKRHEPWADEAQGWLIARDNNNLIDLLKAVKYEGTLPT